MKWLSVAEFQYNDKRHAATDYTLFKLHFERHSQKGDLTVKKITKTGNFAERTTKELENNKEVNGNSKRNHEEIV